VKDRRHDRPVSTAPLIVPNYSGLAAEWEELLARRTALREPLQFWTSVLSGWLRWKAAGPVPLRWSPQACEERWDRGVALLAECDPEIPRDAVEELLGPVMELLASHAWETAEAFQRLAEAWDRGEIGPAALLPRPERDPLAGLSQQFGLSVSVAAFLGPVALRPALEAYFEEVRALPEGAWRRGTCPWCGGFPAYGDLIEDGRRRLSCPLCGGTWIAPRLRCPFCETSESRDFVRLVAEGSEEGYFVEACRGCRGYIKGVDRRQRWNAGSPLVEDWGSPHLDLYASNEGYWRPTPCLAHLVPRAEP
jgi:FdhE protein